MGLEVKSVRAAPKHVVSPQGIGLDPEGGEGGERGRSGKVEGG